MTDSLHQPDALAFVPVPSASNRHDGWTPDRQRGFIAALAEIGVVSAAARAVGMSAKSAYALRHRAGPDCGFVPAWDAALDEGRNRSLDTAIHRAIAGTRVPVFYGGRQVGEWRRHDNRLLFAALRAVAARTGDEAMRDALAPCPDGD